MERRLFPHPLKPRSHGDHACVQERKKLYRLHPSSALYDQIRPEFFQFEVQENHQNLTTKTHFRKTKHEIPTFHPPHQKGRARGPAHVKSGDMVRILVLLTYLCDPMAPQLCHLQISGCFCNFPTLGPGLDSHGCILWISLAGGTGIPKLCVCFSLQLLKSDLDRPFPFLRLAVQRLLVRTRSKWANAIRRTIMVSECLVIQLLGLDSRHRAG